MVGFIRGVMFLGLIFFVFALGCEFASERSVGILIAFGVPTAWCGWQVFAGFVLFRRAGKVTSVEGLPKHSVYQVAGRIELYPEPVLFVLKELGSSNYYFVRSEKPSKGEGDILCSVGNELRPAKLPSSTSFSVKPEKINA